MYSMEHQAEVGENIYQALRRIKEIVYNKDVDYHHLVFNDIKIRVSKDSNIYDLVTIYNLKRRINY